MEIAKRHRWVRSGKRTHRERVLRREMMQVEFVGSRKSRKLSSPCPLRGGKQMETANGRDARSTRRETAGTAVQRGLFAQFQGFDANDVFVALFDGFEKGAAGFGVAL